MANRDARLITKRTSVPGKIPTGTTGSESNFIQSGELASNLADHSLWGYDGVDVFEYGSSSFLGLSGGTISGNLFVTGNLSASTFSSNTITAGVLLSGGTNLYDIFSTGGGSTTGNFLPISGGTVTGNTVFTQNVTATTLQLSANSINALSINSSNYAIGVDGNGFVTYSSAEINGVVTGHRIGRYDGATFRQIAKFESNQSTYNVFSIQSINGQAVPVINVQDHNGNTAFAMYGQERQVIIGSFTPDASAALQVDSSTRGFLPPRLTSVERTTISNPATGLTVFDTVEQGLYVNSYLGWTKLGPSTLVQPGSNITTGGTGVLPTVSVVASPSFNNITFSGSAIGNALSATTMSAGTIYSGSTNLSDIFHQKSGYLLQKAGSVSGSTFSGNPKKSTVIFSNNFLNDNYAISITGTINRTWTIESKTLSGFTINANANAAFATNNVFWIACEIGEGYR